MSGGHNSPVATSCQYHDYIVPMPYFYCLTANLDRSVNTCNACFTSFWPARVFAIYTGLLLRCHMYMWPRDAVRGRAFRPAGQRGAGTTFPSGACP